jgi:hypothetical protein
MNTLSHTKMNWLKWKKQMAETIELNSLVGKHILSGVDRQTIHPEYEDAEQINFVLDGKTYTATQKREDGYRSCMKDLILSDIPVINNFPDVEVMATMRSKGFYVNEILEFYDIQNGKLLLAIGTENTNDYYPMWVAKFHPENIHYNEERNG